MNMENESNIRTIPEGWDIQTLGEVCSVITDGTHYTPKYVTAGVPFYSVESVTNDDFVNVKYISELEHRKLTMRCLPRRGDILMTRIGSLADTKLIDWDVNASIYVSLALLRPGQKIDRRYLYAYTKSRSFVRDIEDRSLVWAVPKKINMGDIYHVPVIFPREPAEQAAIADAVMDAEALIKCLEQLIAKKKSILQGMMQELLTGKARLPGFSTPWIEARLGDITRIKTGSRNNQDKKESGRYPFFVRSATVERIDSYSYDCEAILIPGEGGVGSIFHYIKGKFEVHQRVYKISDFKHGTEGRFIYHYLRQFFGRHAMENSVKATVDSLRLPTFSSFELYIPAEFEEQRAIAEILDCAFQEHEALERRLDKAREIKQAIMQQLLTGRTRLKLKEAVS